MDLESFVRPFQRPENLGTRRIRSVTTQVPDQTAGGTWGIAGNLPVAVEVPPGEDPALLSFTVSKRKEHREVSRETERVRVENPDDPNQYVIIERIKSVRFKEKKPESIAAYNSGSAGTVTKTTPGASPQSQWQPGETQVKTDGVTDGGPYDPRKGLPLYPLKVEERDYILIWPPGPNDSPA